MTALQKNVKDLFHFLQEFHRLKIKPKYDIESYEKVLWFHDIPQEKECRLITRKITSEQFNRDSEPFNKWIEIKKPKENPCPKPPKEIRPWLTSERFDNPEKPPEILPSIIKDLPEILEETENSESDENKSESERLYRFDLKFPVTGADNNTSCHSRGRGNPVKLKQEFSNKNRLFLENCPEIKSAFENWLSQKWNPWAKEEKRLRAVFKVYNSFYDIYKKNETLGEEYQIILGLGLLSAQNEKGHKIKRHIVTTPVSIMFHSVKGTIILGPCAEGAELSLETDMVEENEKPKNCDEISSDLSELSNDFWVEGSFYDSLKSWINSYDSNGQFIKKFEQPETESRTTLTISPAIILRKRNERDFIKFYDSVVKDIEEKEETDRPCLQNLMEGVTPPVHEGGGENDGILQGKHYFPLPVNKEQEKIIEKTANNSCVVVQGPPGTGKTHSIANLICHFLAEGRRILVTSQTDRALKVLKNKLPEGIKPLCVEILGRDQKSFQALKESFEAINSEHQSWDKRKLLKEIKKREEKDDKLKGKLATIKTRLIEIKKVESKKFEKLFGFYTGTPAVIAARVKDEEEKYKWVKDGFSPAHYNQECPVSNDEALSLYKWIKKTKNRDDSVFEEEVEWINQVFTFQQFQEKIQKEKEIKIFLEKSIPIQSQFSGSESMEKTGTFRQKPEDKNLVKSDGSGKYEHLKNEDLTELNELLDSLCLQVENLLNKNEKQVNRALKDCFAGQAGEWKYLHTETGKILDENQEVFKEAEKIHTITIPDPIPKTDLYLQNLLKVFFERYKPKDKIRWGRLCSKIVRKLKKIKIDGNPISSYEDAGKFQKYITAKRALEKINNLWLNQGIDTKETQNRFFEKNYHIFKDSCELLGDCLSVHTTIEEVNKVLFRNKISQPLWSSDSVKRERDTVAIICAERALTALSEDFEKVVSVLTVRRLKASSSEKNFRP